MENKPVVFYLKEQRNQIGKVGQSSKLYTVFDHPFLGSRTSTLGIVTSPVVKILEDGFETMNTVYKEQP